MNRLETDCVCACEISLDYTANLTVKAVRQADLSIGSTICHGVYTLTTNPVTGLKWRYFYPYVISVDVISNQEKCKKFCGYYLRLMTTTWVAHSLHVNDCQLDQELQELQDLRDRGRD